MTGRWRLLSRALTALAVVAAGVVGASGQPAAADPGACTPSVGVVVVVDFRPFGGGIQRGCDSTPTTGFEAIHSAGFATVGTQHDGPGFICRINGLPAATADPCIVTPPATRYWSYWHSDPGQSGWSYSQLGATSYRPKAGSVDAWVYGATDTSGSGGGPTFSPSSVRATAPAPPPPTTTSGGGTGGGTGEAQVAAAPEEAARRLGRPDTGRPRAQGRCGDSQVDHGNRGPGHRPDCRAHRVRRHRGGADRGHGRGDLDQRNDVDDRAGPVGLLVRLGPAGQRRPGRTDGGGDADRLSLAGRRGGRPRSGPGSGGGCRGPASPASDRLGDTRT